MPKEAREIAFRMTADGRRVRGEFRSLAREARTFEGKMVTASRRIKQSWQDLGFGRAVSRARSLVSTVGSIAGAYGFAEGIRRTREFEMTLGDLTIQGGKANAWMDGARGKILKTAGDWGHMKDEVMSFVTELVGFTGEADPAVAMLDKMGMVATATGASFQSLGGMVFQMQQNLGISRKEMVDTMAMFRAMEQQGTYLFKYYAQYGGRLFPMMGQFGAAGRGQAGARAVGGLTQIAARGFGTAAETATGVQTFLRMLFLKRGEIEKKLGVQVMNRDLTKVFEDLGKVMTDNKKATEALKIFAEGGRVAQQLGTAYRGGWQQKAGRIFDVEANEALLRRQAAQRMDQPAQKWKKTMAELDASMHKFLLPVMKRLVDLMPSIAKGIQWAMDNAKALLQTFLAIKAAGILGQMGRFFKTLSGTTVPGGAMVGAGRVGVGVGVAGVPGARVPRTRAGAALKGLSYAPMVGEITLGLLEGLNWLNRATGGPEASIWQTTQFDPGLKRPGVGPGFERFRTEQQLKAEKQTEAGISGMLSNIGVSKAQQRRSFEITSLRGKSAAIAAKRLADLTASKRKMETAYEGKKMPPDQAKAYQDLLSMIAAVKNVLDRFDEKKLNVNVNVGSKTTERSQIRAGAK